MRTDALALAALAVLAPAVPARAQTATRAVAVESSLSAPLGQGDGAHPAVALSAASWLEGDVDAVLRVATGVAPPTGVRAADRWLSGTAGLRWSPIPGAVRPHARVELGWSVAARGGHRLAAGAGLGVEVFLGARLALDLGVALRRAPTGSGARVEPTAAVSGYF